MDFNATLFGQFLFIFFIIFVIIITLLSAYLGRRKTQTPLLATLIGFLLSFITPLGLLYVAVLMIKNDVSAKPVTK